MFSSNFRTLAFALRDTVTDTYALLSAADVASSLVDDMVAQGIEDARREMYAASEAERASEEARVQKVVNLAATTVTQALVEFNDGRKINAIKAVRLVTGYGLRASKEAVESQVFEDAARAYIDHQAVVRALREFRSDAEWKAYNDALDNWCCEYCNPGGRPVKPLPEWERELLGGDSQDAAIESLRVKLTGE